MSVPPTSRTVRRAYLALGRATRLPGKFFLPVDGVPIVRREIDALRSLGLETALVSVAPVALADVPVLNDARDAGPLGALATVLDVTREPFYLFGGDMPFLDPISIASMERRFRGRSVVPNGPTGAPEVLHAIYAGVEAELVDRSIARGSGLRHLVDELEREGGVDRIPYGELNPSTFTDVDTPEDYARVVRRPKAN